MATVKDTAPKEPEQSEADKALAAKGELAGKVRGPDVDSSFHVEEYTDPNTGEPVEWTPVVHDVAVGVNSDGSLKTEKANETYAKPAEEAAPAPAKATTSGSTS